MATTVGEGAYSDARFLIELAKLMVDRRPCPTDSGKLH
jgi:hypothetical protein